MLNFSYTRNKAAFDEGYAFIVEYSDTLHPLSWSAVGPGSVVMDGPIQTVSATIPPGIAGRRFVRVRVMTP